MERNILRLLRLLWLEPKLYTVGISKWLNETFIIISGQCCSCIISIGRWYTSFFEKTWCQLSWHHSLTMIFHDWINWFFVSHVITTLDEILHNLNIIDFEQHNMVKYFFWVGGLVVNMWSSSKLKLACVWKLYNVYYLFLCHGKHMTKPRSLACTHWKCWLDSHLTLPLLL